MAKVKGKNVVVLVGLEASPGVPATLTAADVVPVTKADPGFDIDVEELDILSPSEIQEGESFGRKKTTISIELPLYGPGVAVTPANVPTWTRLLQMCGFDAIDETATGDGFLFTPGASLIAAATGTVAVFIGGVKILSTGCRAMGKLNLSEPGKIGRWSFEVTGQYVTPTNAAPPAGIVLPSISPPAWLGTIDYDGGFDPCLKSMTLDFGTEASDDLCFAAASTHGLRGIDLEEWSPSLQFKAQLDSPDVRNWIANLEAGGDVVWDMTIGSSVGNRFDIDCPAIQKRSLGLDRGATVIADVNAKLKNAAFGDVPPSFLSMRLY